MRISKSSWHYRISKWLTPEEYLVGRELPPTSLCAYVGNLTLCLLTFPILTVIFSPLLLFVVIADYLDSKKSTEPEKPKQPREPKTLLGKWLKARKDKVCPLLEWVE